MLHQHREALLSTALYDNSIYVHTRHPRRLRRWHSTTFRKKKTTSAMTARAFPSPPRSSRVITSATFHLCLKGLGWIQLKNEQYVSSPQISETEGKTRRSGPNRYLIDCKLRLSPTGVGYARSDFDHILQYSEVLVLFICAFVCWLACLKAQPNRLNLKNKKRKEKMREKKSQTYQNETKHWTQILES